MTPEQLVTLRAAVFADTTAAALLSAGNAAGLRGYLNGDSATNVWRTDASMLDILDAVDQSKYTPNDSVAQGDGDLAGLLRLNARALYAQTKLMVLHSFVLSRERLDARPVTVRGSLRDAVITVPTGAAGALTSPGGASGVNVLTKCVRLGTRAEIMLAAGSQASDTTGGVTGRVMTFEGGVSEVESVQLVFKDNGDIWTQG